MFVWWAVFFFVGAIFPFSVSGIYLAMVAPSFLFIIGIRIFGEPSIHRMAPNHAVRAYLTASTGLVVLSTAVLSPLVLGGGPGIPGGRQASVYENFKLVGAVRVYSLSILEKKDLNEDSSALLKAMLLAERSGLNHSMRDDWRDAGVAHFLALSGLHLGLIAIPMVGMLVLIGARGVIRDSIAMFLLSFYSSVAGTPGSLVRALSLMAVIRAFRLAGIRTDLAGCVICGAFMACIFRPSSLNDTGFLLSFCAVSGIAFLGAPACRRLQRASSGRTVARVILPAADTFLLSICIQVFMLPLLVRIFGTAPIIGPVMNVILILPVTALLYMGFIYLVFGHFLGGIATFPINILSRTANRVVSEGATITSTGVIGSDFDASIYIVGVALTAFSLRMKSGSRYLFYVGIFMILIAFYPMFHMRGDSSVAPLRYHGLQGIVYGGNGGVLVMEKGPSPQDAHYLAREMMISGIRDVRAIVICEARYPLSKGAIKLVRRFGPRKLIVSPWIDPSPSVLRMLRQVRTKWVPVRDDLHLRGDGYAIIVEPPKALPSRGKKACVSDASLRISPLDCLIDDG